MPSASDVGGLVTSTTLLTPARSSPHPAGASSGAPVRGDQRSYLRSLVVLDTVVLTGAVLVGYAARFGDSTPGGVPYVLVAPGLLLAWLVSLKVMRCYDNRVIGYGADEYRRVSMASLRLAGAIAIAGYVADVGVSRGFLAISFAVGTIGLEVARFAARKRLHRARSRGTGWSRRVLVVGDTTHVLDLVHTLRREPYAGYQVVGACIPDALLAPVAAAARRRTGGRLLPGHPRGGRPRSARTPWPSPPPASSPPPGCAASVGSWRAPASTWWWPRR